jgi:hypothetical protein
VLRKKPSLGEQASSLDFRDNTQIAVPDAPASMNNNQSRSGQDDEIDRNRDAGDGQTYVTLGPRAESAMSRMGNGHFSEAAASERSAKAPFPFIWVRASVLWTVGLALVVPLL